MEIDDLLNEDGYFVDDNGKTWAIQEEGMSLEGVDVDYLVTDDGSILMNPETLAESTDAYLFDSVNGAAAILATNANNVLAIGEELLDTTQLTPQVPNIDEITSTVYNDQSTLDVEALLGTNTISGNYGGKTIYLEPSVVSTIQSSLQTKASSFASMVDELISWDNAQYASVAGSKYIGLYPARFNAGMVADTDQAFVAAQQQIEQIVQEVSTYASLETAAPKFSGSGGSGGSGGTGSYSGSNSSNKSDDVMNDTGNTTEDGSDKINNIVTTDDTKSENIIDSDNIKVEVPDSTTLSNVSTNSDSSKQYSSSVGVTSGDDVSFQTATGSLSGVVDSILENKNGTDSNSLVSSTLDRIKPVVSTIETDKMKSSSALGIAGIAAAGGSLVVAGKIYYDNKKKSENEENGNLDEADDDVEVLDEQPNDFDGVKFKNELLIDEEDY